MANQEPPSFDPDLADSYSKLLADLIALSKKNPALAFATYVEFDRRHEAVGAAGLIPKAASDGGQAAGGAASGTVPGDAATAGRPKNALPPGDKRKDSRRKDFVILGVLDPGHQRALGVTELHEALQEASLDVPRASLITKLNRLKKDVEYVAWDGKSNATDIRITDAGRTYLKELRNKWLSKSDVEFLSAAVERALRKLG